MCRAPFKFEEVTAVKIKTVKKQKKGYHSSSCKVLTIAIGSFFTGFFINHWIPRQPSEVALSESNPQAGLHDLISQLPYPCEKAIEAMDSPILNEELSSYALCRNFHKKEISSFEMVRNQVKGMNPLPKCSSDILAHDDFFVYHQGKYVIALDYDSRLIWAKEVMMEKYKTAQGDDGERTIETYVLPIIYDISAGLTITHLSSDPLSLLIEKEEVKT